MSHNPPFSVLRNAFPAKILFKKKTCLQIRKRPPTNEMQNDASKCIRFVFNLNTIELRFVPTEVILNKRVLSQCVRVKSPIRLNLSNNR